MYDYNMYLLQFYRKLRHRDISKFHTQLSIAIFGMMLSFVAGIEQTQTVGGCVTVALLIHYFTLASVMWMAAEAWLMFQKFVIVFVRITTRYIVIVSLICWCKFHILYVVKYSLNRLLPLLINKNHCFNVISHC